MFQFSDRSLGKLNECHPQLQLILTEGIKLTSIDFGISEGHRPVERQRKLYQKGRDKNGNIINLAEVVTYIDGINKKGKHNFTPSLAFDVYAWVDGDISWDPKYYFYFNGLFEAIAKQYGYPLEWGGTWKSFKDYPHWQLNKPLIL